MPLTLKAVKEVSLPKESLISFMIWQGYINDNITCLHSFAWGGLRPRIFEKVMSSLFFPISKIKDYYGENIAIYFEWLNFYMLWLSIPAALSFIIVMWSTILGLPITNNFSYSFYSFVVVVWGTLFSQFWKWKSAALQVNWDNYKVGHQKENLRKEFYGDLVYNPVTDI